MADKTFLAEFFEAHPEVNPIEEAYALYRSYLADGDDTMAERYFRHYISRVAPAPKPIEVTGDGGGPIVVEVVKFGGE